MDRAYEKIFLLRNYHHRDIFISDVGNERNNPVMVNTLPIFVQDVRIKCRCSTIYYQWVAV